MRRSGIRAASLSAAALLLLAALCAPARHAQALEVRVASLNLRNYNLLARYVDGSYQRNYPKPEAEKNALRRAICEVSPDTLAVQEIGAEEFLLELQRDLLSEGLDLPHAVCMTGVDKERRIGVLSRIPFKRVNRIADLDFKLGDRRERLLRGLLEIDFSVNGREWTLYNIHLKSRLESDSSETTAEDRRVREARAARDHIISRFPEDSGARYLIVGDVNDTLDSAALRRLLNCGDRRVSRMTPCFDSRGEVWTHRNERRGVYSKLDYILASPGIWPMIVGREGGICDSPDMLKGSDHRIIHVDIEFPDKPQDSISAADSSMN